MSRNSTVNLFGELKLTKLTGDRRPDGRWSPTARLLVAADLPQLGGVHSVVAFSHLAMETLAFVLTARANRQPLYATVVGWLYSGSSRCHVVASQLNFHVTEAQRSQAVGVLKQLLPAPPLPCTVSVNGWQVDIPQCLSGVVDERLFA